MYQNLIQFEIHINLRSIHNICFVFTHAILLKHSVTLAPPETRPLAMPIEWKPNGMVMTSKDFDGRRAKWISFDGGKTRHRPCDCVELEALKEPALAAWESGTLAFGPRKI